MDFSLIMHDPHSKLYMYIENIAVDGKVSQIFDTGPGSFCIKSRKRYSKIIMWKKLPAFFFFS